MILTDTHTHLYSKELAEDIDELIKVAFDKNIERFFLPNVDIENIEAMLNLQKKYPKNIFPMMGLHPCSVKEDYKQQLDVIKHHLDHEKYYAVGEIGIDLYWDKTFVEQQKEAFRTQIHWAKEKKLPIVIHARESFKEIFEIVDEENDDNLSGIFHCFTGTKEDAERIIHYGGFKLGIGGVVTFKNSGLDDVLKSVDIKHLVLETDAPYLAPAPHRGKRNEPSYLELVALKLCDIYQLSLEEIANITTQNSKKVFGI
ncbi:MAG: TatD family hydrolase [Bacteroidia bacterium]